MPLPITTPTPPVRWSSTWIVDHGPAGTGEPLAALLRPGNAGSNTAADHITVLRSELLDWLDRQRLSYSVGFGLTQALVDQLGALPTADWQTALDADREPRPGAWVIEATGLMNLKSWPTGTEHDGPAARDQGRAARPRG